jgi:hypothetical protein
MSQLLSSCKKILLLKKSVKKYPANYLGSRELAANNGPARCKLREIGDCATYGSATPGFRSREKSKIGFGGLGQRHQAVAEEIAVVLVARGR